MATKVKPKSHNPGRLRNVRRIETEQDRAAILAMSRGDKLKHSCDCILNALLEQAKEEGGRGQPAMIERFIKSREWVDQLEASGVPFDVSRGCRMNEELRKVLNKEAAASTDARKSKIKQVKADAVRALLLAFRRLRFTSRFQINYPPYTD